MTLMEAIGIRCADVDVKTGERVSHEEVYGRAIEFLGGLDAVAPFIPYPLDVLRARYKKDKAFNNTSMKRWDAASGFICQGGKCEVTGGGLWYLYHKHGIDAASNAQGVCILKEAARRLIEREVG